MIGKWLKTKRFGRAVLVNFVAGVLITLGVAWALAWLPHFFGPARTSFAQLGRGNERFFVYDYRWFGVWERGYSTQRRTTGNAPTHLDPGSMQFWWTWGPGSKQVDRYERWESLNNEFVHLKDGQGLSVLCDVQYGWPALCLETSGGANPANLTPNGTIEGELSSGILFPIEVPSDLSPMAQRVAFPYAPIWTGLAINSVFFASLFWMVRLIGRAFRQTRRFHRGHCPRCDYELGYDFRDGCSECGWRKI